MINVCFAIFQVRQGLRISKKIPIPLEKSLYELSSESEDEVELVEEADTFVEFPGKGLKQSIKSS